MMNKLSKRLRVVLKAEKKALFACVDSWNCICIITVTLQRSHLKCFSCEGKGGRVCVCVCVCGRCLCVNGEVPHKNIFIRAYHFCFAHHQGSDSMTFIWVFFHWDNHHVGGKLLRVVLYFPWSGSPAPTIITPKTTSFYCRDSSCLWEVPLWPEQQMEVKLFAHAHVCPAFAYYQINSRKAAFLFSLKTQGWRFDPWHLLFTCWSALEQDTEPQVAPDGLCCIACYYMEINTMEESGCSGSQKRESQWWWLNEGFFNQHDKNTKVTKVAHSIVCTPENKKVYLQYIGWGSLNHFSLYTVCVLWIVLHTWHWSKAGQLVNIKWSYWILTSHVASHLGTMNRYSSKCNVMQRLQRAGLKPHISSDLAALW